MIKESSFKFWFGVFSKLAWVVGISVTTLLVSLRLIGFEIDWKFVWMPLAVTAGVMSILTLILVVWLAIYVPYQYFKIKKEVKKIIEE